MDAEAAAAILGGAKRAGTGWLCRCAAHSDKNPSLKIDDGENGKLLVKCFAGCSQNEVINGMKRVGAWPQQKNNQRQIALRKTAPTNDSVRLSTLGKIVAEYNYSDAAGTLLFQTVRYDPKDFRQRQPKPGGGWQYNLKGVKIVPYRLPEIIQAIKDNRYIFVVEGEKDANEMREHLECIATCCPMGAGKWKPEFNDYFTGATVVIISDNDAPGRAHARDVANNLRGNAAAVHILELPGLPDRGDVSDWISAGGTRKELGTLVEGVMSEPEPPQTDAKTTVEQIHTVDETAPEHLTIDLADPLSVAYLFSQERYPANTLRRTAGNFYTWDGACYRAANKETINAEIYLFLRSKRTVSGEPIKPTRRSVDNVNHALKAATFLETAHLPIWLTQDPPCPADEIIACKNGLLHIPTRDLLLPTPDFFNVNAVGFNYDPDADEPRAWREFLESIWQKDTESIDALQEWLGLLLTNETRHQKMLLIVGPRRSGKGTAARIIQALVGALNVVAPTLHGLGQTFGLAPLIGKQVAIMSDVRLSGRADIQAVVENLLRITGEDAISVPRKYREDWTGTLPVRFVLLSNEIPALADSSGALASRFIVLPMTESFLGREDQCLTEKLLSELPGILNWALDGLDMLNTRGYLQQPASGRKAVEVLEKLGSPIAAFVEDHCIVASGAEVPCKDLFDAWKSWCAEQGRDRPGTAQIFGRSLNSAFPQIKTGQPRHSDGRRYRVYRGIRLRRITDGV